MQTKGTLCALLFGLFTIGCGAEAVPTQPAAKSLVDVEGQAIEAESYTSMSGIYTTPGITPDPPLATGLSYIDGGDWVAYPNFDFSDGHRFNKVAAVIATPNAGNTIRFRIDSLTGPVFAELTTAATGPGFGTYALQEAPFTMDVSGVHPIFIEFVGQQSGGIGNIDRFFIAPPAAPNVFLWGTCPGGTCTSRTVDVGEQYHDEAAGFQYLWRGQLHNVPATANPYPRAVITLDQINVNVLQRFSVRSFDAGRHVSNMVCFEKAAGSTSFASASCPF